MDAKDSEDTEDGRTILGFATAADWESWLEAHADAAGIWLKIAKAGGGAARRA